ELMLPGIRQFDLTGRRAVITGGSQGLGQAMAAGLASAGARVMIVGRRAEEAQRVAQQIADEYHVESLAYAADVGRAEVVSRLFTFIARKWTGLGILINNAGINWRGPI